ILDAFGVDAALLSRARSIHGRMAAAQAAAAEAAAAARSRAEREDFLRFQLEQIASAKLEAGEETVLAEARERLRAAGRLAGAARRAEEALYAGEGAAVDTLAAAARELAPLAALDRQLGAPLGQIEEARALAEDAAAALRRYAESVREDPERLAEIEDRLHLIGRLARKHGPTTTEILARAAAFA